ncbi:MAG: molecular chaperone TorD family protein [Hyphomicrobiales bacterium]
MAPDHELAEVIAGLAEDLDLLARLHDHEPDAEILARLKTTPSASWFCLQPPGAEAQTGFALLDAYLRGLDISQAAVDALAAEYAEIYLTFGKRASPTESYWRTDDHIERQEPMFAVREWYAHYGLQAGDWRQRPDDHIVSEMSFVVQLLRDGRPHALQDAGRFLDRHLLVWSTDFCAQVARETDTQFYAGLAVLTQAYIELARQVIVAATGEVPVAVPKIVDSADLGDRTSEERPFFPGIQPSW